jgi:hypothetical protein
MKNLALLSAGLVVLSAAPATWAQTETSFTYQGRLAGPEGVLDGQYDFVFSLYDAGELQVGNSLTNPAVTVAGGHFTQVLDFGPNSFRRVLAVPRGWVGPGEWLEISVRTNRAKTFQTLAPRQRITPTPFASTLTGTLPSGAFAGNYTEKLTLGNVSNVFMGTYYGDGSNLTNLGAGNLWRLSGNSGTAPGPNFVGTIDNQALELRVNSGRALRLEPHSSSPNLIGGFGGNFVSGGIFGAVVAGGGGSGSTNRVKGSYGVVGGGAGNIADSGWSTVSGGKDNTLQAYSSYASIGGGSANNIGSDAGSSVIAGGLANVVSDGGEKAAIGGGSFNFALGQFALVGGGERNQATNYAVAAGGYRNKAVGGYSVVGGGSTNTAIGLRAVVGGGENNQATASASVVGGGEENAATGSRSVVAGGWRNLADSSYATVSGGRNNTSSASYGAVAGGSFNAASGAHATVAGGWTGEASGDYAIVLGGAHNVAQGDWSLAAGNNATAAHDSSFIWSGEPTAAQSTTAAGQFKIHAPGGAVFHTGTNPLWSSGEMSCATLTIRGGADLAEPFAISERHIQPGSVVVIDPDQPGRLKLSNTAYDQKVAGIVSGAGGVRPGISMIQTEQLEGGHNVALSGRVYALVDASQSPVRPGDLLTTSDTPGHAMKAVESTRMTGAILGKAMTPLNGGRGLVLVFVSLQ